jgi:hypothetical protein
VERSRELSVALTLDTIAQRYGLLPSTVLNTADTIDLWVMDVALSWHQREMNVKNGKVADNYSQEQLQELMRGVRKNG